MKGKIWLGISAVILLAAIVIFVLLQKPSEVAPPPPVIASVTPSLTPAPTSTIPPKYDLTVDKDGLSKAVGTMTLSGGGTVTFRFYSNDAPNTVKRITQLISEGFYNGMVIHRMDPGFVIQAGDPNCAVSGNPRCGTGGSGVKLKAEFNSRKHEPGILSMARTDDPDSADSQFFVMLGYAPQLDGKYTIFGKTISGFEHIQKVQRGDKIVSFTIQ